MASQETGGLFWVPEDKETGSLFWVPEVEETGGLIGPAVLSSDMTSAYVLYFPAAAAATPPPPIFPNHTNYQII